MTAHFDEFEEEMTPAAWSEHMITWTSIGSVG